MSTLSIVHENGINVEVEGELDKAGTRNKNIDPYPGNEKSCFLNDNSVSGKHNLKAMVC